MKETRTVETVNLNDRNPAYQSYRLSYAFKQQLMKSWRPKPTLKCAITVYVVIGLIFFALGIALLVKSNEIFELEVRYDNLCPAVKGAATTLCAVPFTLTQKVTAPVYFFYKVTNFYQNHRRYVQSIDFNQLNGAAYVANETYSNCDPVVRNSDLFATTALDGTPLDPQAQAFPCGLVARSLFNDTFILNYTDGASATNFVLQENGIAWPDDINFRYKNSNSSNYRSVQWADVESQRFMTWMKMAPFMDFRKTWGIIQQDMPAGNYTLYVNSRWDASIFGGEKRVVLSTTNTFGGTNYFLAYAYLAIGGVAILLSILFIVRKMTRPKGMLDKKLREYA